MTALAGISDSFGAAAKRTLVKMSGIHLCESTVQRTTEASGAQLGERLEQGEVFGPREDWEWHSDAHGRPCAYVSVDATGILMQGEEPGSAADGRMVYVGMVFNPQSREATDQETLAMPCQGVRYLAGLYTLEELGLQLRRQAAQVGMDGVEQWIALTTVTDALGAVTTTAYDPVGNVLSVTDPDGNKTTMSGSSAAEYLASGVLIPRLLGSGG